MAKRGGFMPGGMPGNMNNLLKQAQKMQKQMQEATEELEKKEYTTASGGGMVEVVINGALEVKSIKIDEEVVDKDDIEMLQDLVLAAVNDAIRAAESDKQNAMSSLTGGLGSMSGLPF